MGRNPYGRRGGFGKMVDRYRPAIEPTEEDAMRDEAAVEQEIQAKNLNAPRLNPALIDATIAAEQYHVFPGSTTTICLLSLKNGYSVIGESACASPENFDAELGRKIALDNARNKIWALEGYLLRQRLHERS